jgi:FixJ family two-component response regulator
MNSQFVLVLGNHANRDLVEVLSGLGFASQVWGSMQHSLDKIRHQKFTAILVDQKFTHADVLEFILNVRDIDNKVPVVVIGNGTDEKIGGKISKQKNTTVLDEVENSDKLAEKLGQVLNDFTKNN